MRDCVMIEISIRSAHHISPQITTGCRRAADWRWWCVVAGARRALHRAASAGGPGSGSAPAAPHIGQPERKLHTAITSAQPSPARYQGSLCQMDQCQCQHVTHAALHNHLMLTRLRWVEEWNGGRWVLGTCKEFNKSVGDLFISNFS